MKKNILVLLLVLMAGIAMMGCGSSKKYTQVNAGDKTVDLAGHMKDVAIELNNKGFYPVLNAVYRYDENGELASWDGSKRAEIDDIVAMENRGTSQVMSLGSGILTNVYTFEKKYCPDIRVAGSITYSSSDEELAEAGFVDWGNNVRFMVWADGKAVNLSEYEELTREYLIDYNLSTRQFFEEKLGYSEDEYDSIILGSYPAAQVKTGYVASYFNMIPMANAKGLPSYQFKEPIDEVTMNSFEAFIAAVELGKKYLDGKIDNYGVIYVSDREINISTVSIETIGVK